MPANQCLTSAELAAALGTELIYDVCGNTAHYFGAELSTYSRGALSNLYHIFEHASARLDALHKEMGSVPSRVLRCVLSEGYFCEDRLLTIYFGGILASSKTQLQRDDRAVYLLSLMRSMSLYQIRTHCIIYSSILRGTNHDFCDTAKALNGQGITICLREEDYNRAMEFGGLERPADIAQHCFAGLGALGLSEGGMSVVVPHPHHRGGGSPFRYLYPTKLGVELYLWAMGIGDRGFSGYTPEIIALSPITTEICPHIEFGKVSWT
jgi:hypothetical protein